jgi:hypothetical protein
VINPPNIEIPNEYPNDSNNDKLSNPIPLAPLYIIKKQFINNVIVTRHG